MKCRNYRIDRIKKYGHCGNDIGVNPKEPLCSECQKDLIKSGQYARCPYCNHIYCPDLDYLSIFFQFGFVDSLVNMIFPIMVCQSKICEAHELNAKRNIELMVKKREADLWLLKQKVRGCKFFEMFIDTDKKCEIPKCKNTANCYLKNGKGYYICFEHSGA